MKPPKSEWPPGPWHAEPDQLEFEHEGLKCHMARGPFGSWCGYVSVPKGHPAFGCSYDLGWEWYELNENQQWWRRHVTDVAQVAVSEMSVHGGLTYSQIGEDGLWWFGFDCAHAFDLCPGIPSEFIETQGNTYRDVDYVMHEAKRLASQLANIKHR